MERASCKDVPPSRNEDGSINDIFFPEKGGLPNEAMMVCFSCVVRKQCDDYRERTKTKHGVWAARHLKRDDDD